MDGNKLMYTFVKHGTPLVVAALVGIRHVGRRRRRRFGGAKQRAEKRDARHGSQGQRAQRYTVAS